VDRPWQLAGEEFIDAHLDEYPSIAELAGNAASGAISPRLQRTMGMPPLNG